MYTDTTSNTNGFLVFIITCPLKKASSFSSASRGFKISHWAVLVCSEAWTLANIRSLVSHLNAGNEFQDDKLGALFELLRTDGSKGASGSSMVSVLDEFKISNLIKSFPNCNIASVGATDLDTDSISDKGSPIRRYDLRQVWKSWVNILIITFCVITAKIGHIIW